ncbi:MAG: S8 family peptidase [Anaerolineae bacterium]|nr:S8 family peptidase [Anaerolineae bacterium]MDW8102386.1 S8 family peptidase [Anaerolineae bacterium]
MLARKFAIPIFSSLTLIWLLFKLVEAEIPSTSGKVVVGLRPGVSERSLQSLLGREVRVISEIPPLRVKVLLVPRGKEKEWINRLRASSLVEYAEPAQLVRALLTPNDPFWSYQWNMSLIGAPQAWDVTTGTSVVTVSIVDTGIDLDHPEFSGRIVQGWNFVKNDPYPGDDNGHGTHVAGIASARGNNYIGIAGMAWNVKILPYKVLNNKGEGYDYNVANAIVSAADRGARVINLSLGGPSSAVMASAVDYASRKGCLLVAAAGNFASNQVLYPAAYPQVMAVSAINYYSGTAWYSNYGPEIEVAAPGGDSFYEILSTLPDDWYGYDAGTSMAAPHVAGLAALIWSVNPGLTAAQVRYCITSTAVDLGVPGRDHYYGYGAINAAEALRARVIRAPTRVFFLADSSGFVGPSMATVSVENPGCVPTSWTAGATSVSWLSFYTSGSPIFQGVRGSLLITATLPPTYGLYTERIFITGTAPGGQVIRETVTVTVNYTGSLFRIFLPVVFR